MADKKLRIGIVGCGGIAKSHMSQYIQMEDVEVVAGCDIVEGKAEKFFSNYDVEGVNFYTSDIEMYEKETEKLNADTEMRKLHISKMLKELKNT